MDTVLYEVKEKANKVIIYRVVHSKSDYLQIDD